MGKFDEQVKKSIEKLNGKPHLAFQWDTGYVVVTQEYFNKMSKANRAKLMAPALGKTK